MDPRRTMRAIRAISFAIFGLLVDRARNHDGVRWTCGSGRSRFRHWILNSCRRCAGRLRAAEARCKVLFPGIPQCGKPRASGSAIPVPTKFRNRPQARLSDQNTTFTVPGLLASHRSWPSCGWPPLEIGRPRHDNRKVHFGFAGCRIYGRIVWRFDLWSM